MENGLKLRGLKWKATSMEDNLNGKKCQWRINSMEEDLNEAIQEDDISLFS